MQIENIVFLGAGASASEGAPVQGALLKEYFSSYKKVNEFAVHHEMDRDLATFFLDFFGIDINSDDLEGVSFPTFEEVLGILELALNRNESFRNYGLSSINPVIQKVREHLILLIALILDEKLKPRGKFHRQLIDTLARQGELQKTCVCQLELRHLDR
jgi:hypothetical protein